MNKMFPLNLAKDTTELKKLIAENPEFPIVVIAEQDETFDNGYVYCGNARFDIIEILDAEVPYQTLVETDRINFEEQIEEWLADELDEEYEELTEEEFQTVLAKEIEKYEPYWKKVIAIYASI